MKMTFYPLLISQYRENGFTLLETLVALAIVAIGIGGASKVIHSSLKVNQEVEYRLLANWAASNRLSSLRLSKSVGVGNRENIITMGGYEWRLVEDITATADPDIVRIDITAFLYDELDRQYSHLFGYKAKLNSEFSQL